MFLSDATKETIANTKNNSLNLVLFISPQMSYTSIKGWGFRPVPYLRASIRFAIPVNSAPVAINDSIINLGKLSFFFCFFLLICISPPYKYIISYG
jgi:hypothetical protein